MTLPLALSVSSRFAWFIEALFGCVASRLSGVLPSGEAAAPLSGRVVIAVWRRLSRLAHRFERLAERARTGRLPPVSPRAAAADAADCETEVACAPARWRRDDGCRLPRHFGWMAALRVPEAEAHAARLRALLQDPEMVALASSHPAFGRVLRPLCHMLGVAPHPDLVLLPPPEPAPSRRRVRTVRAPTMAWERPLPHCDGMPRPARARGGGARRSETA